MSIICSGKLPGVGNSRLGGHGQPAGGCRENATSPERPKSGPSGIASSCSQGWFKADWGAVATTGVFDQLLVAAEVVVCLDAVDAVALVVVVSNVFGQACPPGEGFGVDGLAVCGRGLVTGNGCLLDPVEVRLDEAEECSGGVAGLRQVVFLAPREPAAMQLADVLVWGEFAGFAVDCGPAACRT